MSALDCRGLVVRYGEHTVLDDLDLRVGARETVALLGPSGSGKTTLLAAVAGFVDPDAGTIDIAGRRVVGDGRPVPPEQRSVGVVFQHHALWPHLDALDTVAYPLRRRGEDPASARGRARELLEMLGIGELGHRRPAELSGGQQQRVGLARALARGASLYLFDEPTAHLDAPLRATLQDEITRLRAEVGAAAIYATHDAQEALAVADRVALLRDGRLAQIGTPDEVHDRPRDRWVAELTGPASVLGVDVVRCEGGTIVFRCGDDLVDVAVGGPAGEVRAGRTALLVRPGWAHLGGPLPGRVARRRYRGPHTDVGLDTPIGDVLVRVPGSAGVATGDTVGWRLERAWPLSRAD